MKFWLILCTAFTLLEGSAAPAIAQDNLPEPHLGYGLHLDPNVPVDAAMVTAMGMDWVKLYTDSQIPLFPNKRILFRQDMDLTQDWPAFRSWLAARVQHLRDLGIDAIEVHNEPNLSLEWQNREPNAREYTTLLRESYQVIKSVAPEIIVVSAGLAPTITTPDRMAITDIDYAREMLQNGAASYFDAFGYHPYGYNAPPEDAPDPRKLNFRRTELMWNLLKEFGVTNKQMWMTEFGWLRDPAEDGISCSEADPDFAGFAWLRVDGKTQADYIVRAFAYADQNWPWAGPMFLWNLNFSQRADDGSLPMCSHMRWFGLLRRDGTPTTAYFSVLNMPKRYSRYQPTMTLYADEMTLEGGTNCPGPQRVGAFYVGNSGYPGSFIASVQPAQAPTGPVLETTASEVRSGEEVEVYANTSGLSSGLYLVYINVRTTIQGELRSQNVRGFVILREGAPCPVE